MSSATPAPEPREVPLDAPAERPRAARPFGVLVVTALGLLLTVAGAYVLFANPPDQPVLLLTLALLLALFAYVHVALFRGEGWARAMLAAIGLFAIGLALVAYAVAAGEGDAGVAWRIPAAIVLVEGLVVAYLYSREARDWFAPVAWRESLADVKWAIALLFLTMLALFGMNNEAWSRTPTGREDLGRVANLLLSGDSSGLGTDLPLVFLLQLLGILLVAALIASVVMAMRDPVPGEETEAP